MASAEQRREKDPGTKGPKKPNENPTQTAGNPKQETGQSDGSSGICKASLAPVRWEEVVRGRGEGLSACINATGLQMLVRSPLPECKGTMRG